jgi:hypothetical protein
MKINQFTRLTHLTVASSFAITGFALAVPQELVEGLGNESYQEREKAEQELSLWAKERGETAFDELSEMKKKTSSPEVKSRLDNVLSGVHVYKAVPGTQGFMGISMEPILGGSVITSVSPDTPAERAGLRPNDKIIELDGIDLAEKNNHAEEATDFLRMYVRNKKSGEKLSIKIDREGKILTKDLKLADYNTEITKLDPFGDMGGVQILPMQGGGNMRIMPQVRLRGQNLNQEEMLKLNLLLQKQLQNGGKLQPEDIKELLEQQEKANQKRIEEMKKQIEELKKPKE